MGTGGSFAFNADDVLSHQKKTPPKLKQILMVLESATWYAEQEIFISMEVLFLPAPSTHQGFIFRYFYFYLHSIGHHFF